MADEADLPKEEREKRDKEARAKEKAEQDALPYQWTQTIKDVDILVPVPGNIKGRDLDVVLTKTKLKVALKGQAPIIEVRATPLFIKRRGLITSEGRSVQDSPCR